MSEPITCIFCAENHPATDEHIIPEFVGGSLLIRQVCKTCNDRMGSDFEGPISRSVLFRLPRHLYGIQGKSNTLINAFPNMGTAEDGSKMRVDSQFKPYMATNVEEKKLESGGVEVNLRIDVSDKDKIPQIIEAKIRRTAKNEWPEMSRVEVDALVNNALDSLPKEYEVQASQPTIGYHESIDLNHLTLLVMKIAYEITFHHHGVDVLSDSYNILLRNTVHTRDTKSKIAGTLFPEPDPFSYITTPENSHCVVLCKNMCYVRLFNATAIIQVCDNESEFSLHEEQWVVYWFNFTEKTWRKDDFLEYVLSIAI